jgi:DNA processing protein
LAFGCDSISHQQALDSNGNTVAILPSPLNNILPARNKGLAFQIVEEGGLLVTEYGNDFKTTMELSSRYKERDRLQALFCDTIVLVASYAQNSAERWKMFGQKLDSGARLAMGYAKEYNIPRAVMYDRNLDESNPMFDLNRDLIKEQKDITIITQENVLETVTKITQKNSTVKSTTTVQASLFN